MTSTKVDLDSAATRGVFLKRVEHAGSVLILERGFHIGDDGNFF